MPDDFQGEIATVYNVRDRGLVIISSCGHSGIVNSIKHSRQSRVSTIPPRAYLAVPAQPLASKPVLDTINYIAQRDGPKPELHHGRLSSSEVLQRHLGAAHVVKVFNRPPWRRYAPSSVCDSVENFLRASIGGNRERSRRPRGDAESVAPG